MTYRPLQALHSQSPLHTWDKGYPVTRCARCASYFSYNGSDPHGPIYCVPTPAHLAANPADTATR